MSSDNTIIYALKHSEYLAKEVAALADMPFGNIRWVPFADGETEIQIEDTDAPIGKKVILIGSAEDLNAYADLADLTSAFRQQYYVRQVEMIVPYLAYSTAERSKPHTGIAPRGIYRVQSLFDVRPDRITFFDLHADGIMNVGGRDGIARHLYSESIVINIIEEIKREQEEIILISPDAGRGKWVKSLADRTQLPHDIMSKDRYDVDKVTIGSASVKVKNRVALIFDDMIRTGGTAIKAAEQIMDAGAREVRMIASHAILPCHHEIDAETTLAKSVISRFYVTNSHSRTQRLSSSKFEVKSIAPLIARSL